MIEVENLTKWYGRVLAVDNITFQVEKGMVVGLLGPNGAGKSTTMKILTSYQSANSGRATVAGFDLLTQSLEVRKNVGYMPESVPLYPEMRLEEYLTFRASLRGIHARDRKASVDRVAGRCFLSKPENMMRRRMGELSRGYRQRVGLAEVLLHNPPVLILDEPTIGLDPVQIRSMRELVCSLADEHTVILSSHILAEVEQTCNHLIIIAGGRIAACGSTAELRKRVTGPSMIAAEISSTDDKAVVQAIKSIHGVTGVDVAKADGWCKVVVSCNGQADRREELYRLAVQKGWNVRELHRQIASLEDFFVQITYEQNQNAARRMRGGE